MCCWTKIQDFWPTIKPFLSNKGCNVNKHNVLSENDKFVTDEKNMYDDCHSSTVEIDKIMNNKEVYKFSIPQYE